METSTETKQISKALHKFQGMVHAVAKDSKNPHFKNSYASLEAVWNTARGPLQECGLVVVQAPSLARGSGLAAVTTRIEHAESGEYMQTTLELPLQKNDPQGAGSAITYACRYSLMSMLGLPPTDDDAEAAVGRSYEAAERHSEQWSTKRAAELGRAIRTKPAIAPSIPAEILSKHPEMKNYPAEIKQLLGTIHEQGKKCSTIAQLVEVEQWASGETLELETKFALAASTITEHHAKRIRENGGAIHGI